MDISKEPQILLAKAKGPGSSQSSSTNTALSDLDEDPSFGIAQSTSPSPPVPRRLGRRSSVNAVKDSSGRNSNLTLGSTSSLGGTTCGTSGTGSGERSRSSIKRRTSFTLIKLNVANLDLVGREEERKKIWDAYARVVAGGDQGGGKKQVSGDGDETVSTARSSIISTRDSMSEYIASTIMAVGKEDQHRQASPAQDANGNEVEDIVAIADDAKDDTDHDILGGYPQLVLVNGYSGVGKTKFVESSLAKYRRRGRNKKSKLIYLQGKFDQNHHNQQQAYGALISAFSDLPDELDESGRGESIRSAILEAVGEEHGVLTRLIPGLGELLGVDCPEVCHYDDEDNDNNGVSTSFSDDDDGSNIFEGSLEAKNRLFFIFKKFIASIGSVDCPLVLFLDDLQWADPASLDLIESLVTDRSRGATLIVGTYRVNEVHEDHVLAQTIEKINNNIKKNTSADGDRREPIVDIALDNLDVQGINTLVAAVLRQEEDFVQTLSSCIFDKTMGNPFHTLAFIQALEEEDLIMLNLGTFLWTWDVEKINNKYVTANVADLMKQRIAALSPQAQTVLKITSCLGCEFDERTIELSAEAFPPDFFFEQPESLLGDILEDSVRLGILRPLDSDDSTKNKKNRMYSYCHDQIQAAAFNLIDSEECLVEQANIGRSLINLALPEELEALLSVAIDLCNCHQSLFLSSKEDAVKLASLNLRAGKQAIQNSAFIPAASYLMAGIKAMGDLPFHDYQQLYVELYSLAAQADYCQGDIDHMNDRLDFVLSKDSLTVEDWFPLQMMRCKSLYVRYKYDEAFEIAQKTLKDIGYKPFRKKASTPYIMKELIKTKMLLKKYDESKILNLPMMDDKNRLRAVKVFRALTTLTFQHGDPILPVVVWRWMRWSIKYGLSGIGCVAFASYAVILLSMGEFKAAYELTGTTEKLLERIKPMDQMAFALMCTDNHVKAWTLPVTQLIAHCNRNHEIGLSTGDTEAAMWHLMYAGAFSYIGGKNLVKMEDLMGTWCETIAFYQQDAILNCLVPYRQMVLNLLGYSDDPLVLTGIAMNEEDFLEKCTESGHQTAINVVHSQRLELAYLFGRYRMACEILDDVKPWELVAPGYVGIFRATLFQGLTCYAMARIENYRKWMKRGNIYLKKIQKWVNGGNANTVHMLHLLQAERAWVQGKNRVAKSHYSKAITVASQNGFIQDKALAHECYLAFHLKQGDGEYWTQYHLGKANEAWKDYGAAAKLDYLRICHESVTAKTAAFRNVQLESRRV